MTLSGEHKELVRVLFESIREEMHTQNQMILEAIRQVLKKQAVNEEELDNIVGLIESKMHAVISKENKILKDANIEIKNESELLRLEREKR